MQSVNFELAEKIVAEFKCISSVEAVALGGSQTSGSLDRHSDIDLYVYTNKVIPLPARQAIVAKLGASKADLNLTYWDLGDEWFDLEMGIEVDVIYWAPAWIEAQLERVVVSHQASMGYTTCFWHTVLNSKPLFDRHGWFARLQDRYNVPYPEPLKQAIIAKNYPVLKAVIPSYYNQIKKAVERGDLISLNHRVAAFFASYFDVLFALNGVKHPGEKKVMGYVLAQCVNVPVGLEGMVTAVLQSAAVGDKKLLDQLDDLLAGLDRLLANKRKFVPKK
jgi:predicted nucleotidyltransferase